MLLNLFKIPYVVVYDKDNHKWRTKEEIASSNLKNKQIRSMVKDNLGFCIESENDIEEEIYNRHEREQHTKTKT